MLYPIWTVKNGRTEVKAKENLGNGPPMGPRFKQSRCANYLTDLAKKKVPEAKNTKINSKSKERPVVLDL